MRDIDFNGHIPGDDGHSATISGYNQAMLDMMFAVLTKCHEDLMAVLERIGGMSHRLTGGPGHGGAILSTLLFIAALVLVVVLGRKMPR